MPKSKPTPHPDDQTDPLERGLFGLGKASIDAEERALWGLRQKYGITDDNPEGWRTLACHLAKQYLPRFQREVTQAAFKKFLGESCATKKRAGRRRKWKPEVLAAILELVESDQAEKRPRAGRKKRSVGDAFESLALELPGVGKRRFENLISKARGEAKNRALAKALKAELRTGAHERGGFVAGYPFSRKLNGN